MTARVSLFPSCDSEPSLTYTCNKFNLLRVGQAEELLTGAYALYANFLFTLDDEEDAIIFSRQKAT